MKRKKKRDLKKVIYACIPERVRKRDKKNVKKKYRREK